MAPRSARTPRLYRKTISGLRHRPHSWTSWIEQPRAVRVAAAPRLRPWNRIRSRDASDLAPLFDEQCQRVRLEVIGPFDHSVEDRIEERKSGSVCWAAPNPAAQTGGGRLPDVLNGSLAVRVSLALADRTKAPRFRKAMSPSSRAETPKF